MPFARPFRRWPSPTLLVAVLVLSACRSGPGPQPTATATAVELPTQVAVIPTTTPAPTSTPTTEPTATRPAPTRTPTVEAAEPTPTEAPQLLTVEQPANVRDGPGLVYNVIGGLAVGETATVLGRDVSSTWLAIEFEGSDEPAWIAAQLVAYDGEIEDLPVVTAPPPPPATSTPRPTATQLVAVGAGSANGLNGRLSLCNQGKTTYAVGERVCFVELIVNTTDAEIKYGILGVQATNVAGGGKFQTSWSGQLAPGGLLGIGAGCEGPVDYCNGSWEDGVILTAPGTYRLTLQVCFSSFDSCLGDDGQWAVLSSPITIAVQ